MSEASSMPHPTRRNLCWRTIQLFSQMVFVVFLRYRARGQQNLPLQGGGLILVNHQSFLDPLLVGLPLRRQVSYLARDSLFRVPMIGWILRNTYVIPINRQSASSTSIKKAVERMKAGFLVGIFPEGTRTRDGQMSDFKPGFIALVRRSGLPVYPVGIAGADQAMPRHLPIINFAQVRVVYGEPFTEEEIRNLTQKGQEREFLQQAEDRVRQCHLEAEEWLQTNNRNQPEE